jgi:hypothetical protein
MVPTLDQTTIKGELFFLHSETPDDINVHSEAYFKEILLLARAAAPETRRASSESRRSHGLHSRAWQPAGRLLIARSTILEAGEPPALPA